MAKDNGNILRYAGLATQWMVMLLIAVWGGHKLDQLIGWRFPVLLIIFPLAALVISLWALIKEFNKKK
ncbi:MAG: ATPase F0F1 [Taibaiella sp.]|nr:ATPase F0F1 [Taibaiella sp.]